MNKVVIKEVEVDFVLSQLEHHFLRWLHYSNTELVVSPIDQKSPQREQRIGDPIQQSLQYPIRTI